MAYIEFKNVTKKYFTGSHILNALDGASFTVDEGEFVVILGPSGAGKSTLLNLLGGMENVTSGEIIVDGINICKLNSKKLTEYRASDVGFVFQFYNLIPTLTAIENIELVCDICKNALPAKDALEQVGLLDHKYQFPSQLSGGEQQRVSIARAISKNPKMLLCDEPTGALDSETGVQILTLLQNLCRNQKKTVIIVTHNSALAEAADKVIHVKNGRIRETALNDNPKKISEVVW
ncbi:MAG: ABC transporter ATP-binding protein [Clostridiales bacterium]|nr:ABC transporter ATP-binding protein [Clostridiales bacterium]